MRKTRSKSHTRSTNEEKPNGKTNKTFRNPSTMSMTQTRTQKAIKKVQSEPWFHGLTPVNILEPKLVVPGDWLVRTTELAVGKKTEMMLCVNIAEKVANFPIAHNRLTKQWHINVPDDKLVPFSSVVELIEYYRRHRLPNAKTKLKRAILREKWQADKDKVEYNEKKDLLGAGNFGRVYKAKFKVADDKEEEVAVKVCIATGKKDEFEQKANDDLRKEGLILSHFDHANVIKFYGMVLNEPPIMIIIEFCPGGNLLDHLIKAASTVSTGERVLYCYEAAKGMNYLHQHHYTHRDLAARNCLISKDGVVKISDFGLSQPNKDLKADNSNVDVKVQIPLRWMAPETLKRKPKFSFASDMWSFSVLIYEIFNEGNKPWPNDENKGIAHRIRKAISMDMPKEMPEEFKKLFKKIWQLEPEKRPTFLELLPELFELHNKTYPCCEPEKCVLNKLPGVVRIPFDVKLDPTYKDVHVDVLSKKPENSKLSEDEKNTDGTTTTGTKSSEKDEETKKIKKTTKESMKEKKKNVSVATKT